MQSRFVGRFLDHRAVAAQSAESPQAHRYGSTHKTASASPALGFGPSMHQNWGEVTRLFRRFVAFVGSFDMNGPHQERKSRWDNRPRPAVWRGAVTVLSDIREGAPTRSAPQRFVMMRNAFVQRRRRPAKPAKPRSARWGPRPRACALDQSTEVGRLPALPPR